MKNLIVIFSLLAAIPHSSFAQDFHQSWFMGSVKSFDLPPVARGKEAAVFNIHSNEELLAFFPDSSKTNLPEIDFKEFRLMGGRYCSSCLAGCSPGNVPCHRNACWYQFGWLLVPINENAIPLKSFAPVNENAPDPSATPIVFTSNAQYQKSAEGNFLHYSPDFSQYSLVGLSVEPECNGYFNYFAVLDNDAKEMIITQYEVCQLEKWSRTHNRWIWVPALPEGFTVRMRNYLVTR
jgi:hypothetical protein